MKTNPKQKSAVLVVSCFLKKSALRVQKYNFIELHVLNFCTIIFDWLILSHLHDAIP